VDDQLWKMISINTFHIDWTEEQIRLEKYKWYCATFSTRCHFSQQEGILSRISTNEHRFSSLLLCGTTLLGVGFVNNAERSIKKENRESHLVSILLDAHITDATLKCLLSVANVSLFVGTVITRPKTTK
jgi:hypothetical protein